MMSETRISTFRLTSRDISRNPNLSRPKHSQRRIPVIKTSQDRDGCKAFSYRLSIGKFDKTQEKKIPIKTRVLLEGRRPNTG